MDRETIIDIASNSVKLIRAEYDYTQDKMAETIGISKKTLVQIEKGRMQAGWTTTIAICALFRNSPTLQNQLGGDPVEVVELTAHDVILRSKEKTFGGYIWWRNIEVCHGYRLQQNVLSQHFRILDDEHYRLLSTNDEAAARTAWDKIEKKLREDVT
ncbi:MAG: helix-turn-helix domain-containing protein [Solibacillus sp.]